MAVAEISKRGQTPTWFAWLHMVATLTLAAFMMACITTYYWAWGLTIWLAIVAIWAFDLTWKLRLLTSDRVGGAIDGRQHRRERLSLYAGFAVAPVLTTAILLIVWQGQSDLQRRLSLPPQHAVQAG